MKKLVAITAVAAVVFLSSCGPSPLEFNNKVVAIQKGLLGSIDSLLPANDTTMNFVPKFTQAQDIIKERMKQLEAVEAPEKGKKLKAVLMESFTVMLNVYSTSIKSLKASDNDPMKEQYAGELADLQKKAEEMDEKVEAEQKAFAKEHNFRLENK